MDIPVMNARYEGITGRIHGDRNVISPANKATNTDTFSVPSIIHNTLIILKTKLLLWFIQENNKGNNNKI
jgi:hypothetical protein